MTRDLLPNLDERVGAFVADFVHVIRSAIDVADEAS